MDRIIEVKVNGHYLTKDNKNAGVQGEANATYLRIEFDEGWDGLAKTLVWTDAKGNVVPKTGRILTADLLEDIQASTRIYLAPIPGEVTTEWGQILFAIDGYINGKRQRSVYGKLVVKPGDGFAVLEDVTPSQAEQLQVQIDTLLADIQAEAIKAAQAAGAALQYKTAAARSAEAAEGSAKRAEDAAKALEYAQSAIGKSSYIGEDGHWYVWDSSTGSFVDSGISAKGGKGVKDVALVAGDHSPGTTDTYRMSFDDGSYVEFGVYNGANGDGAVMYRNVVVPVDAWTAMEEKPEGFGEYNYMALVDVDGAQAAHFPRAVLTVPSVKVAGDAGVCPTMDTYDGGMALWSVSIPASELYIQLELRAELIGEI